MIRVRLLQLCFLLASLPGVDVCYQKEIYVAAGDMVALECPRPSIDSDAKVIWTNHTTKKMELTSNMSSAEQMQMDVLVHGWSLVILKASVHHQGNYSCSLGNGRRLSWYRLTVYTKLTQENTEKITYPQICYTQESCELTCPDANIPVNTPDITFDGIIWHKEGESLPKVYFKSVEEGGSGVYTCTRSYLYCGQIYNMTFTVELDVKPSSERTEPSVITSPRMGDVFYADLGSPVVIHCKADLYSDTDEVLWLIGKSFVRTDVKLPVFYNFTIERDTKGRKMTASLVFKSVSEEDLSKNYTCKLTSDSQSSSSVTISLAQKPRPSYVSLALGVVCIVVVMGLTLVIYVKFKTDIALFLRDTLGCRSSTSDGKSYDAFLMCYKSDTDAGLNEYDRQWLMAVLEEKFGYSLCLYERDVLPGKAVADAVLDCVEQSRTVVLVPTSSDHGPGSGLLGAIHAALVERQTRLVFIKTEATEGLGSSSVSEALQLLSEAGNCVTWKGIRSMPPSSSFFKQLRFYLPAPQHAPKIMLSHQII